jgi:hypothetical protein
MRSRLSGHFWCSLSLLLCTLLPHLAVARELASERPSVMTTRPITRLAAALVDAPESMRAEFAVAAITEMVADYNEEADRARREARSRGKDGDLNRWAIAVDAYAAKLTAIANRVTPATQVTVNIGVANSISVDIDDTPVLVSSPRLTEQSAFEQRVLTRFCNLYPCDDLIDRYQPPQEALATSDRQIYWSFSQQAGPSCSTADGLEFQFQDIKDIGRKRVACAQVVQELYTLANAIASAVASGDRVDWGRLAIHTVPGQEEQRVVLSSDGNALRLPLPALRATNKLFVLVRPWLAAKVAGEPKYPLVILNADSLMAPLIEASEESDLYP